VYREIEMPLVPVLERMEANGVQIDMDELRRQSTLLAQRMHALQLRANEMVGRPVNLDSTKQLGALLFEELKLPALVKTPGGAPSTNEEALEAIADQHELPRLVLEHRALGKLRNTYTEKLPLMRNPPPAACTPATTRPAPPPGGLSSNDPNLQNIPIRSEDGRRIRQAFVAPPGAGSSPATTPRSSCASWRTCPRTRPGRRLRQRRRRARRDRRGSVRADAGRRSRASSAAPPRRSTSG
jgi:DNA polymerase-1